MWVQLGKAWRTAVLIAVAIGVTPAAADDATTDPADWQAVITGQIEAFRAGEDAMALFYAGRRFRYSYADPASFVAWIRSSGYGPLIDSLAHAFGAYDRLGERAALQLVRLDGSDMHSYEALFELGLEPEGWRVHAVTLREVPGVNI